MSVLHSGCVPCLYSICTRDNIQVYKDAVGWDNGWIKDTISDAMICFPGLLALPKITVSRSTLATTGTTPSASSFSPPPALFLSPHQSRSDGHIYAQSWQQLPGFFTTDTTAYPSEGANHTLTSVGFIEGMPLIA